MNLGTSFQYGISWGKRKIGTEATCYSTHYDKNTPSLFSFIRLVHFFFSSSVEPGGCKTPHQTLFSATRRSVRVERQRKRGKGGILSCDFGLDGVFSSDLFRLNGISLPEAKVLYEDMFLHNFSIFFLGLFIFRRRLCGGKTVDYRCFAE